MALSDSTGYVPNSTLSYVALALFGLLAAIYWLRICLQGNKLMLVLCLSTTTMAIGFAVRIPMTANPYSLGVYIVTTLFTLLSPCGFLAQNYLLLPRLARLLDAEQHLVLPSRLVARIFIWSDFTTFWMQAIGGGMSALQDTIGDVGQKISLIGLIAQCISFGSFTALNLVFGFRVMRNGVDADKPRWRRVYYAICWTCIGILVRSGFRVAEYAEGYSGHLRTTEVYFYTLDSLPLFVAIVIWTVVWPPRYLVKDRRESPIVADDAEMATINPSKT